MRPFHVAPLVFAAFVPLHAGPPNLFSDSVIGVVAGVVAVVLYLAALRWTGGDRRDAGTEGTRNRDRGTN